MASEEEGIENTDIWKAMDTNTGGSPGYQCQPNSLETNLVTR